MEVVLIVKVCRNLLHVIAMMIGKELFATPLPVPNKHIVTTMGNVWSLEIMTVSVIATWDGPRNLTVANVLLARDVL